MYCHTFPLRRRAGYLYVAVLFTSLIISTMGLVALNTASLRTRSSIDSSDRLEAELLALAAVEDAVFRVTNTTNWRTSISHNVQSTPITLGRGTYTWSLKDSDGSLSDDDSDSVQIVGIGRVGRATVAESLRLIPSGSPLPCLESALHCNGNITVGSATAITTDQFISSNGNITASATLASVQGNAQATGTASGNITGSATSGVAARRMPGSSVFDYYLDSGTYIPISSIPLVDGIRTIERTVVSPITNPYGSTNPEGVYVIDCAGQRIRIRNCRIVGTIVLLNLGSNSALEESLRWDSAVANYPALLVDGQMEVQFKPTDLSEVTLTFNANPTGVPFLGNEDADILDTYPSEIKGLVYFSNRIIINQDLVEKRFRGIVICNNMTANSSCRFNYRQLIYDVPPPGFASGNPMVISPGSRRRETLP